MEDIERVLGIRNRVNRRGNLPQASHQGFFASIIRVLIGLIVLIAASSNALAIGWLDLAQEGRYQGWACMPGTPSQIDVHIWRGDGVFLGGVRAALSRELAVRNACGSTHSNHGFDLRLSIPDHLKDGRTYKVHAYAIYPGGGTKELGGSPANVAFSLSPAALPAPNDLAAVVGRDLDMSPQGLAKTFGHVGVWDGERVLEMLNEGAANRAKRNTWQDFSLRTKVWSPINPSIPRFNVNSCFQSDSCIDRESLSYFYFYDGYRTVSGREAVVRRARQIFEIGSSYTLTTGVTMALPRRITMSTAHCNPFSTGSCAAIQRSIPPQLGVYRCDTFVIESFASSVLPERHPFAMLRVTLDGFWQQPQVDDWTKKMRALVYNTTYLPSAVYNRIREF